MFLAITDMASFLTEIGAVLTAVWLWVAGALGAVEAAIVASFLLQLTVGVAIAFVSLMVLQKVAKLVVSFIRK